MHDSNFRLQSSIQNTQKHCIADVMDVGTVLFLEHRKRDLTTPTSQVRMK